MNISWLGHSCFKFEEKIKGIPVVVITDPYSKSTGFRLPKLQADILTVSHFDENHSNLEIVSGIDSPKPMIFDRPGEYEVKSVFVNGIGAYHDTKQGVEKGKVTMFKFEIDGVTILHCGDLATTLSDAQLAKIEEIDILLIPIGGKNTLDGKKAAEVVKQIEPRIVIPMHYSVANSKIELDTLEKFKQEIGKGEVLPKLKISKKDLPQEDTKVIILEKV